MDATLTRRQAPGLTGQLRIHSGEVRQLSLARFDDSEFGELGDQPLSLQVDEIGGRRLFAIHDPGPLTHLALGSGTYRITARHGEVEHRFLVSLGAREAIDLHLRSC